MRRGQPGIHKRLGRRARSNLEKKIKLRTNWRYICYGRCVGQIKETNQLFTRLRFQALPCTQPKIFIFRTLQSCPSKGISAGSNHPSQDPLSPPTLPTTDSFHGHTLVQDQSFKTSAHRGMFPKMNFMSSSETKDDFR